LELIRSEWTDPQEASDHVGFYHASQEDGVHSVLIGREVVAVVTMDTQKEDDAVVDLGLGGADITSMPRSCGSSN
jgi:hypothetical protein